MPDETLNDEIANLAVLQAFKLIQAAVGSDEELVILTETRSDDLTVDLWLFFNPKSTKPFIVTNDGYGSSKCRHTFEHLPEAMSFYREIRSAGSFREYYKDNPDKRGQS